MEHICPVCNGLTQLNTNCPRCGEEVKDHGSILEYFGPYAPYQDLKTYELTGSLVEPGQHRCIHIANCPHCQQTIRIPVNYIDM